MGELILMVILLKLVIPLLQLLIHNNLLQEEKQMLSVLLILLVNVHFVYVVQETKLLKLPKLFKMLLMYLNVTLLLISVHSKLKEMLLKVKNQFQIERMKKKMMKIVPLLKMKYIFLIFLCLVVLESQNLVMLRQLYKKTENMYNLKLAASRYVLTEASKRFGNFPFTLRSLDEKRGRLGIVECSKNNLMDDYPVVYEQDGEFVAQFKFTVLLLPNSIQKLNAFNLPFV